MIDALPMIKHIFKADYQPRKLFYITNEPSSSKSCEEEKVRIYENRKGKKKTCRDLHEKIKKGCKDRESEKCQDGIRNNCDENNGTAKTVFELGCQGLCIDI